MRELGSRYVLHTLIGIGANGQVWRGSSVDGEEPVAVKLLHDALAQDGDTAARFERERSRLTGIRAPNLVSVRDLVTAPEQLAIVMDLVDGCDLQGAVQRNGPPAADVAFDLAAQVLEGLAVVHGAGLVHGDLKPENVLVDTGDDERLRARLTDFGLAPLGLGPAVTSRIRLIGTPAYLAPEAMDEVGPTPAADLYGVGALLYELLAGRPPFEAATADDLLRAHREQDPAPVAGLDPDRWHEVSRLLAKDPAARPHDAREAAALLRGVLHAPSRSWHGHNAKHDRARPGGRSDSPAGARNARRRRNRITGLATVAVTTAVVAALLVWSDASGEEQPTESASGAVTPGDAAAPGSTSSAGALPGVTTSTTTSSTPATTTTTDAAAPRGPWGELQALADAWSGVVPSRPNRVGPRGQRCEPGTTTSRYATGRVVCRFRGKQVLFIESYATPQDRERQITVEATKKGARESRIRIAARPKVAAGSRVTLTGVDAQGEVWLWWAYREPELYSLYSRWHGHTLRELQNWWDGGREL